jgi:predicted negative regulator of RcsB-dependent stress response
VDQQTKAALKQDKFVSTTTHSIEWATEHRKSVLVNGAIALGVILVVVIGGLVYNSRSDAASAAFGAAMQVYQTPLAPAGQMDSSDVKTYSTATERAKAANSLFQGIADKYGCTPAGRNARYFAGLTSIEAGQNDQAEATLKKVAGGWDSNLAGLAKFALAQLYHNSGRDDQAIDIYTQLKKKPTATIPASLAQLQLADLYQSEGKTDQAKAIYAMLKQDDAKSVAGAIASEKLNPGTSGRVGQ